MTDPRNETIIVHIHLQFTGIINDKTAVIFSVVNLVVFGSIVSTFGLVSNCINIVVFLKQGFMDTANVSLFALALSDVMSLLTLQWMILLLSPLFYNAGVPLLPEDCLDLAGGYLRGFFARLTSWIMAYITLERCLCVLIPLKVKMVVTPTRAVSVLTSIFLLLFLTILPDYATSYIGYKFDDTHNRSVLGLQFTAGRDQMTVLSYNLSTYTHIISFMSVFLFTAILVIKMKEISRWRRTTSNVVHDSQKGAHNRDIKTVNMVILIAIVYCICYLPRTVINLVTSFEPEFTVVGRYHNLYLIVWSFADLADSFNSSVSIFIYYRMGSKYKIVYLSLLKITVCGKLLRVM